MISLFFIFSFAAAFSATPALKYQSVACVYSVDDKEQKKITQKMMTLVIEEDLGRFAQIQFGDQTKKIQYQILLETDAKDSGAVNVLQNLLVDKLESSAEFSAVAPSYVRLAQGIYSVRCELIAQPLDPVAPSVPTTPLGQTKN